MKIEFQLKGEGKLPPSIESEAIPQQGDTVEYEHADYLVTGIRYMIEKGAARIIVEIQDKDV